MEYKVITKDHPHEVWAMGFYGEHGKAKAKKMIDEGYFHRHMYEKDKDKTLVVVVAIVPK